MEASLRYHRLLQTAQSAFVSLNKENIDTCLIAIFFMSRFESAIHHPIQLSLSTSLASTLQTFSHHDGALAALKFWKEHLSDTYPATDVIKHTRRGMLRSALMRNLALPKWIQEGSTFGEHDWELEYDSIVIRIVNIRQQLCMILNDEARSKRNSLKLSFITEEFNEEAEAIDKALRDWIAQFPGTWSYSRHTLSKPRPGPIKDFYSPIVYKYSSPAYAAVWNQYHAMRMLLNSTRWRVLQFEPQISTEIAHDRSLECLFHIKTMANDLASSVPYCLERFKVTEDPYAPSRCKIVTPNTNEDIKPYLAGLLIWPLTIASTVKDVEVQQKLWFKSELARLGRMIGVGVFECAETDHWLEL
ncbi:hypothetical protein MMC34_003438 [Xylographa carneopallida]|nr:hypothetical protein [Xylographa carneopallida]